MLKSALSRPNLRRDNGSERRAHLRPRFGIHRSVGFTHPFDSGLFIAGSEFAACKARLSHDFACVRCTLSYRYGEFLRVQNLKALFLISDSQPNSAHLAAGLLPACID